MLLSLSISNYALIQKLDMQFSSGFAIITGETGAGKSILLGALSLVLGQRADTSVLKNKEGKCVVEVEFKVENSELKRLFEKYDIDYSIIIILRREIASSGKSRAFVNDTPVNLNIMREIGLHLVDIHSQHQNLNLGDHLFQLGVVDTFANHADLLNTYRDEYENFQQLDHQYKQLLTDSDKSKQDLDYLRFQFQQLEEANLVKGEQDELEAEQKALSHSEEIKMALLESSQMLENDESDILSKLKEAGSLMQKIENVFPEAEELSDRLQSAYLELKDIHAELDNKGDLLEVDPNRLQTVNDKLDLIYSLQQKHKVQTVEELIELKDKLDQQINNIDNYDIRIEELKRKLHHQKNQLLELSNLLSENRSSVIPTIESEIIALLQQLGIVNASFKVDQAVHDDFNENGRDEVLFLFSANKNTGLQDISLVASGGELSRLMLCIKYIISKYISLPTIIFDEVDTGVSGEIADKVGNMMIKMSENIQLVNITHLPQIAAKGHEHFLVYKQDEIDSTFTKIKRLSENERISEIAKMLSGEQLTDAAIENAKVLLTKN